MFPTPDWEPDVPKQALTFDKVSKKKNIQKKSKDKNNHETAQKTKKSIKKKIVKRNKQKEILTKKVEKNVTAIKQNKTVVSNVISTTSDLSYASLKRKLLNKKTKTRETNKINSCNTTPGGISEKHKSNQKSNNNSSVSINFNSDKPDEELIKEKRNLLIKAVKKDDEEMLFFESTKETKKTERKKEIFREMLKSSLKSERTSIKTNGAKLRERMLQKLKAAQFRYLNEKLYTSTGNEAKQLFQTDPQAFHTYHEGYQQQLQKWPVNPLDVIVKSILKMPKSHIVADMGCGQATLSKRVPQSVRSFDLVAAAPTVEACDMAHTPLLSQSVDVVVYCLALMGTDLAQYLVEANRVLKEGGQLLIAEVESRFDDVDTFTKDVQRLGFKLTSLDKSHQVFYFMQFKKMQPPPKKSKLPNLTLKPCLYKKR